MNELTPVMDFAAALAAFQAEIPGVGKDKSATIKSDKGQFSYSFADLTKVTEKAFPLLSKHGLAFLTTPKVQDGEFGLSCKLLHIGGHVEEGFYPIPKGTAQQTGSHLTYARRYSLCAMTGIAPGGEDDDGARASEVVPTRPAITPKARLWNAAKAKGWTVEDLKLDYAATHEGELLDNATPDQMAEYAETLEAA